DYKRRPWEREQTRCICPYCGDGCSMLLETRDNRVYRTRAFLESGILRSKYRGVNDEFLCVKGRFGYQFLQHPERLSTPLVRRNSELKPASWDEALDAVAEGFRKAMSLSPDTVGFIGSERCSNEAAYLFQKLARAVIGTNNIDCRTGYKRPPRLLPPSASTPLLRELRTMPGFLVIGANPSDENPLAETEIRMSVRRSAGLLVVADPRRGLIVDDAIHFLRCRPGTEAVIAVGIARAILKEKGLNIPLVLANCLRRWNLDAVQNITGVPESAIRAAARNLCAQPRTLVMYGLGLLSAPSGEAAVLALHVLADALQWPDPMFLAPFNNTRGALDMGVLPDTLPGYRPVQDGTARAELSELWGAQVPSRPGLDVRGMLQTASAGELSALYVMGANPVVAFPDGRMAADALQRVPFLVVQDIFLSETAKYAHVVLPACAFAEQDGTYTNIEGRVQRSFPALDPPGEARTDVVILFQVAQRLGANWGAPQLDLILEEIGSASGIYAGVTAQRLEDDGTAWPRDTISIPPAHIDAVPLIQPPQSQPPPEYPLALITGQLLFHSGTLSAWAEGLRLAAPHPVVEMHRKDASRLSLSDGDTVVVESTRGSLRLTVKVSGLVPEGAVFVPMNYPEAPANVLMDVDAPIDYVRIRKA
ncbi:MAG: molybdopterin oxidoreductase family protein, partial [Armatimonadota bacterium]